MYSLSLIMVRFSKKWIPLFLHLPSPWQSTCPTIDRHARHLGLWCTHFIGPPTKIKILMLEKPCHVVSPSPSSLPTTMNAAPPLHCVHYSIIASLAPTVKCSLAYLPKLSVLALIIKAKLCPRLGCIILVYFLLNFKL